MCLISTYRIISKAGFLFVIIGFFMPIVFGQNGFQIINHLSTITTGLESINQFLRFLSLEPITINTNSIL